MHHYAGGEDFPGRERVDEALAECDQLVLRRTAPGDLWSVSSGKVFNCAHLHAALADPDTSVALQIALDTLEPNDWAARSMLARSYWPAVARWPIAGQLKSPVASYAKVRAAHGQRRRPRAGGGSKGPSGSNGPP